MHDDFSCLIPFHRGFVPPREEVPKPPAVVWEKSLPTNEFFSILIDEGKFRIGKKTLDKIGTFRVYLSEGDAIGESQARLLEKLRSASKCVAEMSPDGLKVYFNCWAQVFTYLRTTVKNFIIDRKRKHTKDIELKCDDYESLCELLTPVRSASDKIKLLDHACWVKAIENDVSKLHQEVLLLQLKGFRNARIARLLKISPAKLGRIDKELISCFKRMFSSPEDLLEAMDPDCVFIQN